MARPAADDEREAGQEHVDGVDHRDRECYLDSPMLSGCPSNQNPRASGRRRVGGPSARSLPSRCALPGGRRAARPYIQASSSGVLLVRGCRRLAADPGDRIALDQIVLRVGEVMHVEHRIHRASLSAQFLDMVDRLLGQPIA